MDPDRQWLHAYIAAFAAARTNKYNALLKTHNLSKVPIDEFQRKYYRAF